jgi:hypothetical protein
MTEFQAGRSRTVLMALAIFAGFAGQALGSMEFQFAQTAQVVALAVGMLCLVALVYEFARGPRAAELSSGDEARAPAVIEPHIAAAPGEAQPVFSSINEGLFFFDRNFIIGTEYSPVLKQILRRENFAG